MALDETHDAGRRSWVASANVPGCEFPIQNLPFGVFVAKSALPRGGVAIGDQVLDVAAAAKSFGFAGPAAEAAEACSGATLNRLMSLGRSHWRALRLALSRALSTEPGWEGRRAKTAGCLVPITQANLLVPARIGDYT